MNYGFDLDDTLTNTANILNEYAIKFDREYLNGEGKLKKIDDAKDYYHFADALGWNNDDIKLFFEIYYLEILKNVAIKPTVRETISKLKDRGDKIYIITARREIKANIVKNITKNSLEENGIVYDDIFIDIQNKSEKVKELKIDIFVDDGYKNCLEVKENTSAKVYMIETPFNKGIYDISILKIKSLNELLGDEN